MGVMLGFDLGWGCGDRMHHIWGRDWGTLVSCSGSGRRDDCTMHGVGLPAALPWGWDMGTFVLGSGSGWGDP